MASAIYQITNLVSGNRYVGSAINHAVRWRTHRDKLNAGRHENRHLQASWQKYGAHAFGFIILEEVEDQTLLLEREQYWMDTLKPEYNINPIAGSRLGTRHSAESKLKLKTNARWRGVALSAEHRARIADALHGRSPAPEHRRRLAEANQGRSFTDERRANISKGRKGIRPSQRSEAHRQHLSEALKGHAPSEATLAASRAANVGRTLTEAHKAKVSAALLGKKRPPRTPEQVEHYRQAALKRMADPAHRQAISDAMKAKGIAPSMEARLKGGAARR